MVILTNCSTSVMGIFSSDLRWCILFCFISSFLDQEWDPDQMQLTTGVKDYGTRSRAIAECGIVCALFGFDRMFICREVTVEFITWLTCWVGCHRNFGWWHFWFLFPRLIMTLSIHTDAPWTKCAGAGELWRIDEAEEDEPTFKRRADTQTTQCPLYRSRKEPFVSSCLTKTSWTSQSG